MTFPLLVKISFISIYVGFLLRLSWIDIKHQLLPDNLTYPLLWSGLLFQICISPEVLPAAVIGAMMGYLILWVLYWLYLVLRKEEGIGYGDMKLLAALGAWHGWQNLHLVLLIAAASALVFLGIKKIAHPGQTALFTTPLPFGPFLAIAGGVTGWLSFYMSSITKISFVL